MSSSRVPSTPASSSGLAGTKEKDPEAEETPASVREDHDMKTFVSLRGRDLDLIPWAAVVRRRTTNLETDETIADEAVRGMTNQQLF